jgi:hypothetical protein
MFSRPFLLLSKKDMLLTLSGKIVLCNWEWINMDKNQASVLIAAMVILAGLYLIVTHWEEFVTMVILALIVGGTITTTFFKAKGK